MQRLTNFFMAIDPGWVRLEQSVKGAVAYITAAVLTVLILALFKVSDAGAAVIYSLLVAFISYICVNDGETQARQRTLLLANVPFAVAPFAVAFIGPNPLIDAMILLLLVFLSYYFRRYGIRAAELGIMTTFAFYFSLLFGANQANASWFAVGAIVGVLSAYFWEFFVRPYDAEHYLHGSLRGLDQNCVAVVKAIQKQLTSLSGMKTAGDDSIASAFAHVQRARQTIEQYLTAVTTLSNYPPARLTQLRLQLFNVEEGLQRLVAGSTTVIAQRDALSDPLRASLHELLSELQLWLQRGTEHLELTDNVLAEEMSKFATIRQRMSSEVRGMNGLEMTPNDIPAGEPPDKALKGSLLPALWQSTIGVAQVARAVGQVRVILTEGERARESAATATTSKRVTTPASAHALPSAPANAPLAQRLHPTTKLGIQATLAVGLAMLAGVLFDLEHSNWAFWTAYIVVAGSTGESLRKIFYRVAGTVAGAFLGTLLVLILPQNLWLTIVLALFCLFLALYTRIVNYAWMVFWIVIFVALLYSLKGEAPRVILITRPVNTLIGALIAVAVVWFVFPLHAGERFGMGLVQYLQAVDHYISALVAAWLGQTPVAAVDGAKVQMEEIYDKVAEAFPAVAFEYNPVTQARSPLSSQTTIVQAIHNDVVHLTESITTSDGMTSPANPAIVKELQSAFHHNVQELNECLTRPFSPVHPSSPINQTSSGAVSPPVPLESIMSPAAESQPSDWQKAVTYFGQLNHAVAILRDEVTTTQPRRAATTQP